MGGNLSHFQWHVWWWNLITRLSAREMIISCTFRWPRPLNRGVRLIKVSSKVNEGNKFGDCHYRLLNGGCPLNTGFTVHLP